MAGVDIDSDERVVVHRRILLGKPMLQQVLREFYEVCVDLDTRHFSGAGGRVELGGGSTILKHFLPHVISTDIKAASHLDIVVDAQAMPFADESVRAFYAIDCFHHLPQPESFFRELRRTLVPGGGCVLIEPYYGPVARQLFKRLFASESFDPDQVEWSAVEGAMGSMGGANQALSYIVFERDRAKLREKFPELRIVREFPMTNYLRYLSSGGVNFRPLLPHVLTPALRLTELVLSPARRLLALHHVIALRKDPDPRRKP